MLENEQPFQIDDYLAIKPPFRFQWEEVQNAYVLLYPEGMIKLNETGGEILRHCTGEKSVTQIVRLLEEQYQEANLENNICTFLKVAYEKGWIGIKA